VFRFRLFSKIAWDQSLYGALDLKNIPHAKTIRKSYLFVIYRSIMRAKVVHLIYDKGNLLMTSFLLLTGITSVPEPIINLSCVYVTCVSCWGSNWKRHYFMTSQMQYFQNQNPWKAKNLLH